MKKRGITLFDPGRKVINIALGENVDKRKDSALINDVHAMIACCVTYHAELPVLIEYEELHEKYVQIVSKYNISDEVKNIVTANYQFVHKKQATNDKNDVITIDTSKAVSTGEVNTGNNTEETSNKNIDGVTDSSIGDQLKALADEADEILKGYQELKEDFVLVYEQEATSAEQLPNETQVLQCSSNEPTEEDSADRVIPFEVLCNMTPEEMIAEARNYPLSFGSSYIEINDMRRLIEDSDPFNENLEQIDKILEQMETAKRTAESTDEQSTITQQNAQEHTTKSSATNDAAKTPSVTTPQINSLEEPLNSKIEPIIYNDPNDVRVWEILDPLVDYLAQEPTFRWLIAFEAWCQNKSDMSKGIISDYKVASICCKRMPEVLGFNFALQSGGISCESRLDSVRREVLRIFVGKLLERLELVRNRGNKYTDWEKGKGGSSIIPSHFLLDCNAFNLLTLVNANGKKYLKSNGELLFPGAYSGDQTIICFRVDFDNREITQTYGTPNGNTMKISAKQKSFDEPSGKQDSEGNPLSCIDVLRNYLRTRKDISVLKRHSQFKPENPYKN